MECIIMDISNRIASLCIDGTSKEFISGSVDFIRYIDGAGKNQFAIELAYDQDLQLFIIEKFDHNEWWARHPKLNILIQIGKTTDINFEILSKVDCFFLSKPKNPPKKTRTKKKSTLQVSFFNRKDFIKISKQEFAMTQVEIKDYYLLGYAENKPKHENLGDGDAATNYSNKKCDSSNASLASKFLQWLTGRNGKM